MPQSRRSSGQTRARTTRTLRSVPRRLRRRARRVLRRTQRTYRRSRRSVSRRGRSTQAFRQAVVRATVPLQLYTDIYGGQFTANQNSCVYYPIQGHLGENDINNMFTVIPTANASTNISVEKGVQTLRLINQDNARCRVTVYKTVPRYDLPTTPALNTVITNGFGTTGISPTDITSTLYDSKDFVENYKIVSAKTYFMEPGTETVHYIKSKPLIINHNWINAAGLDYRRCTQRFIVRCEGSVANDSSTTTAVGTTGTKVNYVVSSEIRYRYVSPVTTQRIAVGTLTGMPNGAQFINEETDQKTTEITA